MTKKKHDAPSVATYADHEVITPPNPLRGMVSQGAADDPVARAEAALAQLSSEFSAWMDAECERLIEARDIVRKDGFTIDLHENLFRAAHDIKGEAATFGFPAVAQAADSLCRLLEHTPDLNKLPEVETLRQYPAVILFQQRAQALKPDFQVTRGNAATVAEICVRLDGLPLSIELAAARIKLLPPNAILSRLERRLQLLTGGALDLPLCQQTLRDTLAWSYDLLEAGTQRLFRRLAVFTGGCCLEAVEAVTNIAGEFPLEVLDRVDSLIDKSLLFSGPAGPEGEPRLMMLESIREYALAQLALNDEEISTRQAHAGYYLVLAETAEPYLIGTEQQHWLDLLELEHDNFRAALA